jgi:hypothetical protein
VVATSTFVWEVAGSNPIGATFVFFNLILARCGMHVGMRMRFAGRGEWERQWQSGIEWALRGGEMGMAEHGMAAYPLPS